MGRISDNEYMIRCACKEFTHSIVFTYYDWKGAEGGEFNVRLCIYCGSLWNRIKNAFKHIFHKSWNEYVDITLYNKEFDIDDFAKWVKEKKEHK